MTNTPTAATPRSALTALHDTIAHDTTHAPPPSRAHISAAHAITQTKHNTRQNETKSNETRRITQTSTHSRRTLPQPRLRAARSPPYTERSRTSRYTRRATPLARHTGGARDHEYETQNASKQDKIHGNQRIVITRGTGARDTTTPNNHSAHSTRPTGKHVDTTNGATTPRRRRRRPQTTTHRIQPRLNNPTTQPKQTRTNPNQLNPTHTQHEHTDNARRQQEPPRTSGRWPPQLTQCRLAHAGAQNTDSARRQQEPTRTSGLLPPQRAPCRLAHAGAQVSGRT